MDNPNLELNKGTTVLSIFHSGTLKSTTNSDTFDSARQLKSITIILVVLLNVSTSDA